MGYILHFLNNFFKVQRIDVASQSNGEDLEWSIERQYHEFYSLQSALVQYHGEFEVIHFILYCKISLLINCIGCKTSTKIQTFWKQRT